MMTKLKTTNADFELFQKEAGRWLEFFGLYEWRVEFVHDPDEGDAAGWCSASLDDGVATIALFVNWGEGMSVTKERVLSTARHEVLELLMWPMFSVAVRRYTTYENINQARHNIIRRIECALDRLE